MQDRAEVGSLMVPLTHVILSDANVRAFLDGVRPPNLVSNLISMAHIAASLVTAFGHTTCPHSSAEAIRVYSESRCGTGLVDNFALYDTSCATLIMGYANTLRSRRSSFPSRVSVHLPYDKALYMFMGIKVPFGSLSITYMVLS